MVSIDKLIQLTEELIRNQTGSSLSYIQKIVLRESLGERRKSYVQIARENHYSEKYIRQLVAPQLWKCISAIAGEKVNRSNCLVVLEKIRQKKILSGQNNWQKITKNNALELPEGYVSLASSLYIERNGIEGNCYREISYPGAFIRIKGAQKTGKTSLIKRINTFSISQNYHSVYISLRQAESSILNSAQRLLRWLCANITQQLKITPQITEYWDEELGALVSCNLYFQEYLLPQISLPLVLTIDDIERLFTYPALTRDFLTVLRSWYEKSKDVPNWQKLRLLITHATDIYIPLEINHSPFNVGLAIELPNFSLDNIEDLAQRQGLQLTTEQLQIIQDFTGGIPYLVRVLIYQSLCQNLPVETLVTTSATYTGIFGQYLHSLFWQLRQDDGLCAAFEQVLKSPLRLAPEDSFRLKGLGLIELNNNKAMVSCGLYRQYFGNYFPQQGVISN